MKWENNPPGGAAPAEGGTANCGERLPGEGGNLRSVGIGSPYGGIAETQREARPPQLCCEETTPAEGGAPKCGQRSPGEGEDLDVKEREFPSGGTEDPNEGGTVVWNCWVKKTDIGSVISPPMKETSQGMGRGIEFIRVTGMGGGGGGPFPP